MTPIELITGCFYGIVYRLSVLTKMLLTGCFWGFRIACIIIVTFLFVICLTDAIQRITRVINRKRRIK